MITRIFIWHSWTNWYFTPPHRSTEVNYLCNYHVSQLGCPERRSQVTSNPVNSKPKLGAAMQTAIVWTMSTSYFCLIFSVDLQVSAHRTTKRCWNKLFFCCVWPQPGSTSEIVGRNLMSLWPDLDQRSARSLSNCSLMSNLETQNKRISKNNWKHMKNYLKDFCWIFKIASSRYLTSDGNF